MKKVYVVLAVAALTLCVASCGNKKAAKQAEPAAAEEVAPVEEAAKEAEATLEDAAKEAAEDVAKTAIDEAANAAKEAIKGE